MAKRIFQINYKLLCKDMSMLSIGSINICNTCHLMLQCICKSGRKLRPLFVHCVAVEYQIKIPDNTEFSTVICFYMTSVTLMDTSASSVEGSVRCNIMVETELPQCTKNCSSSLQSPYIPLYYHPERHNCLCTTWLHFA